MRLTAEVLRPNDVEMVVTVSMKVIEWREILEALKCESFSERWWAAKFHELLREQVRRIEYQALGIATQETGD